MHKHNVPAFAATVCIDRMDAIESRHRYERRNVISINLSTRVHNTKNHLLIIPFSLMSALYSIAHEDWYAFWCMNANWNARDNFPPRNRSECYCCPNANNFNAHIQSLALNRVRKLRTSRNSHPFGNRKCYILRSKLKTIIVCLSLSACVVSMTPSN